jgi:branched-chain amino acid transport system permease protein
VDPTAGDVFAIIGFVVVVLGGLGSVPGALIGGVVIGVAEALGAVLIPGSFKELLIYGVFLVVLLFRPSGLFGVQTR